MAYLIYSIQYVLIDFFENFTNKTVWNRLAGRLAQLVERTLSMREVEGSKPSLSTPFSALYLARVPTGKYGALRSTHMLSNQDRSGHRDGYATANYNITLISLSSSWFNESSLHIRTHFKFWRNPHAQSTILLIISHNLVAPTDSYVHNYQKKNDEIISWYAGTYTERRP